MRKSECNSALSHRFDQVVLLDPPRGNRVSPLIMTCASHGQVGIASQIWRQPLKFQRLGKPLHWAGLTGCRRQRLFCSMTHAPELSCLRVSPERDLRSSVKRLMKSSSVHPRYSAILDISALPTGTSPGHRQQLPHVWHW